MSTKEYIVRRWLDVPAWFKVSASSPQEARDKAYDLVLAYVNRMNFEPQAFEKGDCVVADALTDKTVLAKYED